MLTSDRVEVRIIILCSRHSTPYVIKITLIDFPLDFPWSLPTHSPPHPHTTLTPHASGKTYSYNMHNRKRSLKYVSANNQESERRFPFYLIMLSYLNIDNFFPSEIEFCKIWLQSQFVVLRNHVCGKSLEVLLCRGHSYRSNTKTDLR